MPDKDAVQMVELEPAEKSRTYTFANCKVTLENVVAFCARPSGTHRLKTEDGKLHIVPTGWVHIEIDVDSWTV